MGSGAGYRHLLPGLSADRKLDSHSAHYEEQGRPSQPGNTGRVAAGLRACGHRRSPGFSSYSRIGLRASRRISREQGTCLIVTAVLRNVLRQGATSVVVTVVARWLRDLATEVPAL